MPELRGALLGLGLLFLAGLALWEWRRSRRRYAPHDRAEPAAVSEPRERARRIEPSMEGMAGMSADPDESLEVPTIHPVEPVRLGVAAESAVDIPAAARFSSHVAPHPLPAAARAPEQVTESESGLQPEPAQASEQPALVIQWPPENARRILSLRVASARGEPLQGRALRNALEAAGLLHGPQRIYHRVTTEGVVLASVANLVRPGDFDPALMDAQEFRGLSVFSILPGALPPLRTLDELVELARGLAHRLSAVVQDEYGADLDGVRLTQLRQSLQQAAGSAGDGTSP
jgi:cell division protein ZipA